MRGDDPLGPDYHDDGIGPMRVATAAVLATVILALIGLLLLSGGRMGETAQPQAAATERAR